MTKYAVKQPPGTRVFHATAALVAIVAWFVASNHCALAGFVPPPAADASAHSHCHGSSEKPADDQKERECDGSKCCNSLNAPTLALAKSVVTYDGAYVSAPEFAGFLRSPIAAQHDSASCELDTGPPGGTSFAESVLQRSILAHAPPFFA